jgi:lysophospholipase L1-like esterase
MNKRVRDVVHAALLILVFGATLWGLWRAVFDLAAQRALRPLPPWLVIDYGTEPPAATGDALCLGPRQSLEVRVPDGLRHRALRLRLRLQLRDFHAFELGLTNNSGNFGYQIYREDKPAIETGREYVLLYELEGDRLRCVLGDILLGDNDRIAINPGSIGIDRLFLYSRWSDFHVSAIELATFGEDREESVYRWSPTPFAGADAWLWLLSVAVLLALLGAELWIGFRLRISPVRTLHSWLMTTAPAALIVGWAGGESWTKNLAAPVLLLWLFARLRFWLLERDVFRLVRFAAWRAALAIGGMAALGVVTARYGQPDGVLVGIGASVLVFTWLGILSRDLGLSLREGATVASPALSVFLLPAGVEFFVHGLERTYAALLLPWGTLFLFLPLAQHRKRLRHYGYLMLLSVALLALTLELSLRHSPVAPYCRPAGIGQAHEPDDVLFWVPKGLLGYSEQSPLAKDQYVQRVAFRGHETAAVTKPPGTMRILVMGGSNAWGDGQPTNETTFAGRLESQLRQRGLAVEVLNGGVSGYNSFQVLVLLVRHAIAYQPDLVIFYLGRNDEADPQGLYTFRELWKAQQARHSPAVLSLQRWFHGSALYNGWTRVLLSLRERRPVGRSASLLKPMHPVSEVADDWRDLVEVTRRAGAQPVFVTEFSGEMVVGKQILLSPRIEALHATMKRVANEMNVPLLDAWSHFAGTADPLQWVLPHDVVHLNAAGHAELAQLLDEFLDRQSLLPEALP